MSDCPRNPTCDGCPICWDTQTASDLQRALSERDEARAEAARVRKREAETMEAVRRLLSEDWRNHATDCLCPWCGLRWAAEKALADASTNPLPVALSSSAGAGWLSPEEAERLRAEAAVTLAAVRDLLRCEVDREDVLSRRLPDHGCAECVPGGPLTGHGFRCALHRARALVANPPAAGRALLEEMEGLRRKVRSLEKDVDALNRTCCERNEDLKKVDAEAADLRARLERAEAGEMEGSISALLRAEVRRAVEEAAQTLDAYAEGASSVTGPWDTEEVVADVRGLSAAIRARK